MSTFGLSKQNVSSTQLLTHGSVYDIFLNTSFSPRLLNASAPVLPLNPPDTLLKLFQSLKSKSLTPKIHLFSLLRGIPVV